MDEAIHQPPPASATGTPLVRSSPYSYECRACQRCCQHKLIRVNPFEVLHLARAVGLSTTGFLARHVDRATAMLRLPDDGRCRFLDAARGCTVHAHRPLVCRLYPLGRRVSGKGEETFVHATPHPQTEGRYGVDGTIDDFLASQGAHRWISAVDELLEVFHGWFGQLVQQRADIAAAANAASEAGTMPPDDIDWMDVDLVLARAHGAAPDAALPIEAAFTAYLQALRSRSAGPPGGDT